MLRVTIAGASGYIGKNLIEAISQDFRVKALSRTLKKSEKNNIHWSTVDLFSYTSTAEALVDTDIAIYLVHSMLPSTKLFQGSFHDTDLMLADNFAKACKKNKVKQIIYLSGIVPEGKISLHLESRKEVEDIFLSTKIPCTVLRAGLVVGNGGSSFEILKNLVINLPAMVLPKWTQSKTQVIYIDDMIGIIKESINSSKYFNQILNTTNGENLTYKSLIELVAKHVGKSPLFITVPINYSAFSKLWVTIFGQSQYELVSPLVDSLLCDFSKINSSSLVKDIIRYKDFKEMLGKIDIKKQPADKPRPKEVRVNSVRSIQRLATETEFNASDVAKLYMDWLPSSTNFIINVKKNKDITKFCLFGIFTLLELKYIPDAAMKDRAKFHVVGGLLTKTTDTGWLEFRSVSQSRFLIVSINEFIPSLPWSIYKFTQAPVHNYVMNRFGKYLVSLPK